MSEKKTPIVDAFAATPRGLGTGYHQALEMAKGLELKLQEKQAELDRIRAKNLVSAIERICQDCGHTTTEDGCPHCMKLAAPKWTKDVPKQMGIYWHWNGDEDSAPLPYHVRRSGTDGKCFVTAGQYHIEKAFNCEELGGWWMPIETPELPSNEPA